eukprot:Nitzschia sp. Nitz4//scaffold3_size479765//238156//240711//NITZ4_000101-RA/size479765-processed-gene-1.458-mRNA-1//1//CDS//3329550761//1184//frame0
MGKVATLAEASVIGSSGQTVALATMASASMESPPLLQPVRELSLPDALRQLCKEQASFVPLTVDYRQRHHAVGKIPTSSTRTDNKAPTNAETLAGRAIDRALRPLLNPTSQSLHIACSIQSCPIKGDVGGYPVSLALNAASVALKHRLSTPVAAVFLSLHEDGTVTADPSAPDQSAVGSLLYAGTRDKVVMMEFSGLLSELTLNDLITLAHGCVQPLLDIQEDVAPPSSLADTMDDDAVRAELGLELEGDGVITVSSDAVQSDAQAQALMESALSYCREKLANSSLKLFGVADPTKQPDARSIGQAQVHPKNQPSLRSKSERGRREHIFQKAVLSTLQHFQPEPSLEEVWTDIVDRYPGIVADMAEIIHSRLLREAFGNAAIQYHSRADGRGSKSTNGCTTVRPLSMDVPALPGVVHGSSLFTRGETQVLCTVTLGPPKDGILLNDPFNPPKEAFLDEPASRPSDDLPVGSLRYLKTQEYLESDLNSRKVRADREQTGDSGVLKERRRAFLQYDFPAYSKGEVQSGPRGANRREIGHGALAEKAILPILPPANEFPYAMRMTSEVTGSNGSSSMASVCGATLALLDAGVPIKAPVAGVSVGLAMDAQEESKYQLLLDITGTEDHYGIMDFKIAGTRNEVTAMHLDVHEPLPHAVVFEALDLARSGRGVILDEMSSQAAHSSKWAITDLTPRPEQKPSAPRVEVVRFDAMRKKDLLGPGGAVIRQMEDRFNVSLDLTQEGQCLLFGDDREMVRKAKVAVMDLVADVEVGGVYEGTVIELRDFGAIIELLRNKEGLCHVSELARRDEIRAHPEGTVGLINSILRVGQKIDVECTAVDTVMGTIRVRPAKKDSN